jgi:hypothetical protein
VGALAALRGSSCLRTVSELDPVRCQAWALEPGVELLAEVDGWQQLAVDATWAPCELVLVDPYDFDQDDRWCDALPNLARIAAHSCIALYVYNRSPRGAPQLKAYRRLRAALSDASLAPRLVARVAADSLLPRAFHEMLLIDLQSRIPRWAVDRLAARSAVLARAVLEAGHLELAPSRSS